MSKCYTNQATGLTVISGIVKSVSEDRKEITVTAQEYVKAAKEGERGSFEEKDVVLRAPVPVEDLQAGDLATATGFKAGAGKINIDTISSQNSYIEAEGLGVLSGKVLFANVQTEIDRETGQPRLTQAGNPKKPHFDITVATGSGQDRVTHTVKIYNTKENDNIARYERLFANFDREKNPIYVSIVTKAANAQAYMRESKDKQGRIWQNQCMSHMGANSIDVTFLNGLSKEAAQEKSQEHQPQQQAAPEPAAASGFGYNLDDFDMDEDLSMA